MNYLRVLLAALCLAGAAYAEPRKQPNVILVMPDDQGYGDLACHGNPYLKTPHLDTLHGESVRLTNFHVDPTCSPTRAALLTGRYSIRTGVWHTVMGRSILRRDETTLAQAFQASGYSTGLFGKWHLGDNYPYRPQDRGFDEVLSHGGGGVGQSPDYWGNDYIDDTYYRNGKPEKHEGYCTDVWFNAAMEFVEKNAERPFFAYITPNAPHSPYIVPEEYAAPYRVAGVPNPEFYGMIANIDENMGRLMAKLDALGLERDTILIFMTDNGSAAGATLDKEGQAKEGFNAGMRGRKGTPYDGGHRVPCFVRWPGGGLDGGRNVPRLSAHIDILPTLIALCGLMQSEGFAFDGVSIEPLLRGEPEEWPDRMLFLDQQRIDHPEKWRGGVVMTERWRLIENTALFDMEADPAQRTDVSTAHPEVMARLREGFDSWWESVSTRFGEYAPIVIGAPQENPTRLGAMDLHGKPIWDQTEVLKGTPGEGFWAIEIAQAGTYTFALRRWPAEANATLRGNVPGGTAIAVSEATLRIGDREWTTPVGESDEAAVFQVDLEAGETRIEATLQDEAGAAWSAYYVDVRFLP